MRTLQKVAALVGMSGAYALFLRPRMLRWGATRDEVRGPFPGAEIIPGGKRIGTMAVTLDAPPSQVWPWLAQMGCGRAGWYSWDRLDNAGRPSARLLHPEWQSISIGERIASDPEGKHWFEVAAIEPERFLGLRAAIALDGRQFDSTGPRPRSFADTLWAFQLKELPGGRTRLIVSGYSAGRPRLLNALVGLLFWEPAHWIMQTRQFANLKWRAEGKLRKRRAKLTPEQPSPSFTPPSQPHA
jgi:hypothetical protein